MLINEVPPEGMAPKTQPTIAAVRAYVRGDRDYLAAPSSPADPTHWGQGPIASPLACYEGEEERTVGGSDWPGYAIVEVETEDGTTGIGITVGGIAACWIVEQHLSHLIVGRDPFATEELWERLYRGSLFYGRRGIAMHAVSAVDLALWDLKGKLSGKPVVDLLGGPAREALSFYATSPNAPAARESGYIGCKLPLRFGMAAGQPGFDSNVEAFAQARDAVGSEIFLAYDCWMSMDVDTSLRLALALEPYAPRWLEECLIPDDYAGHARLREGFPSSIALAAGEHEATRWGYSTLINTGRVDIVQPDPSWCGGLTELLKIASHASSAGKLIALHDSGPYGLHASFALTGIQFAERILSSADGSMPTPSFGGLIDTEPLPNNGTMSIDQIRAEPGFGIHLNAAVPLVRPVQREERKRP